MTSENPKCVEYVEVMLNHDEVMILKDLVCDTMEEGLMKNNLINALAHGLLQFGSSHNMRVKAFGYTSRSEWTDALKKQESAYARYIHPPTPEPDEELEME